ncbi:hypothetical protein [Chitiniphilus eburneus]|uniref:TnsE C-terminal domain-containing protein n=1 Tax=Chitiniphilus eburneus TaxID=2571148 RepID=A0A4U0Q8D9_9NEIS|nr:hypothetical protein [Chitiniphilus eburneus]TJZ77543.1 hypothetical protein FAZ21_04240 [Chitiniphilus eburneus]
MFGYKPLAKHPGVWRVDGFSHFVHAKRAGTFIRIHFALVTSESKNKPYTPNSLVLTANSANFLTLTTHIARIRYFRVGTTWENGLRVGQPGSDIHLTVNPRNIKFLRFGESLDIGGRYVAPLPNEYFRMPDENRRALSQSYLAALPVNGNLQTRWLILPMAELLAFYFGVSTRLPSWITSGRYKDKFKGIFLPETRTVELHTNECLSVRERKVLARCFASDAGLSALRTPHQHQVEVRCNNQDHQELETLVIKALFPFGEPTTLTIAGKHFQLDRGNKIWGFYGMRIIRCSHRPDFDHIHIISDHGRQGSQGGAKASGGPPNFDPKSLDDLQDARDQLFDDTPADPRLRRMHVVECVDPFSGLDHLTTELLSPDEKRSANRRIFGGSIDIDGYTHGDGDQEGIDGGKQGVDAFEHDIVIARQLEDFQHSLDLLAKQLNAKKKWKLKYRNGLNGPPGGKVAIFSNKLPRSNWHLVIDPKTMSRTARQVVFAEFSDHAEQQFFYLFEMQLRHDEVSGQCTILLHRHDFLRFDDRDCEVLFELTQVKNRWPKKNATWDSERHKRMAAELFGTVSLNRVHHPKRPIVSSAEADPNLIAARHASYLAGWAKLLGSVIDESIGVHGDNGAFVSRTRN